MEWHLAYELTQQCGSLTRLASDLGQAHQKVHLYGTFPSSLPQDQGRNAIVIAVVDAKHSKGRGGGGN